MHASMVLFIRYSAISSSLFLMDCELISTILSCLVNFLTLLSLVKLTSIRFEWFTDLGSTSFDLGFLF